MSKKVIKFIGVILCSTLILECGIPAIGTYAENNSIDYAHFETDQELIEAEKMLNEIIEQSKQEELEELEDISYRDIDAVSENSEETTEIIEDISNAQENLEDLESYDEIETVSENIGTDEVLECVEEVEETIIEDEVYVDPEFIAMCESMEELNSTNGDLDPKEAVKIMNEQLYEQEISRNKPTFGLTVNARYTTTYSQWSALTTAEKLLIASSPVQALITKKLTSTASQYTVDKFGYNGLGDKADAYRHAIWNALMTSHISKTWAAAYATAHETKPASQLKGNEKDGYSKARHKTMDLHNNKIGRACVKWYELYPFLKNSTLKSRVSKKLTNKSTELYWLHN